MYNHILVPIAADHPETTSKTLEIAKKLLAEGGTLTLFTVLEPIPAYVSQYLPEGQLDHNKRAVLTDLEADVAAIPGAQAKLSTGHPAREIEHFAAEHDVDCIVMASHRPGMQDYFLGSTAARVVRHAKCSVHVLR